MKKLGIIVNPLAGIGGRVGLKGSDGSHIQRQALDLGARPLAGDRATAALRRIGPACSGLDLMAWPGEMGEIPARNAGLQPRIVGALKTGRTGPRDTIAAAGQMVAIGADLILFSGGDGTARDIHRAVGSDFPVLGIPAGVKMHSAVYGINPVRTGDLAAVFLNQARIRLRKCEVMDLDEATLRRGRVQARLYGYLSVPYEQRYLQARKSPTPPAEKAAQAAIARRIVEMMDEDCCYLVGPGTTTQAVLERLGLAGTLVGVDVVFQKRMLKKDASERDLLTAIDSHQARVIVTLIGGQGFIFGRGNQQISPLVLERVGRENIVVAATADKIQSLYGRPLLVDTGDANTDRLLTGYISVITGYTDRVVYRVTA